MRRVMQAKKARPCVSGAAVCFIDGQTQPSAISHRSSELRLCQASSSSSAPSSPERYVSSHAAAEPDTSCGVKRPHEASVKLPVEPAHHLSAQRLPIAPAST